MKMITTPSLIIGIIALVVGTKLTATYLTSGLLKEYVISLAFVILSALWVRRLLSSEKTKS